MYVCMYMYVTGLAVTVTIESTLAYNRLKNQQHCLHSLLSLILNRHALPGSLVKECCGSL